MPRTTKKAEREALAKKRRQIRRKLQAKKNAKTPGPHGRNQKSHPHRRSSTIEARR
jgi:hypothetical protein